MMKLNAIRRILQEPLVLGELICPLLRQGEKIRVVDGGAGSEPAFDCWSALPANVTVTYGFDLDFGGILWSKCEKRAFYQTATLDGASLFRPNGKLLRRLRYTDGACLADHLRVERESEVECTTIDKWRRVKGIPPVDFIKLNVQGSELPILEGASETLPSVLGLQLEATFVESYSGQAMFSELDNFVRKLGFVFFDFLAPNVVGRMKSPVIVKVPQIAGGWRWPSRQVFEGHFLWLRDPIGDNSNLTDEQVLKLACIAEAYGQVEYAFELLVWLKERMEKGGQAKMASALADVIGGATNRYRRVSLIGVVRKLIKWGGRGVFPDRPLFNR